jgi:FkbM family methyltransferase
VGHIVAGTVERPRDAWYFPSVETAKRRTFLLGALAGVCSGAAAGVFAERASAMGRPAPIPRGQPSFAQHGEDLILKSITHALRIARPTYIDIGAHEPVVNNNTYLFYTEGSRGVLVEPNPLYAKKLRAERPEDEVLELGIGFTAQREADYYMIKNDDQLNTFSKEQAEELEKLRGKGTIERVVKMPLVSINEVFEEHFPKGGPNIVSVDTEGLDYDILRSLDFARFRPQIVCAETAELTGATIDPIFALMQQNGYVPRGGTFVNTVFIDEKLFATKNAAHL